MTQVRVKLRFLGRKLPTRIAKVNLDIPDSESWACLIDEAKSKLGVTDGILRSRVRMYLDGGAEFVCNDLEKDDIIYVAFDGAEWREAVDEAQPPLPDASSATDLNAVALIAMQDVSVASAAVVTAVGPAIAPIAAAPHVSQVMPHESKPTPCQTSRVLSWHMLN